MDLFRMEDVSFRYEGRNETALFNVNLSIAPGEFAVICGRSGGGKSTLLKMLKTALRPRGNRTGAVYFDGCLLDSVPFSEQDTRIAFVGQRPEEQFEKRKGETVENALLAQLCRRKLSRETARLWISEMASFFGLQGWFDRQVSQLSGGQRQLFALAAAMSHHPEALLLDEPTSQLDPIAAREFFQTVAKLSRETGVAAILCEHRLEDVLPLADRMVVVDGGTVSVNDSPRKAASLLETMEHPMSCAMPAPIRIYQKLRPLETHVDFFQEKPPLTVREGREFLNRRVREAIEKKPEQQIRFELEQQGGCELGKQARAELKNPMNTEMKPQTQAAVIPAFAAELKKTMNTGMKQQDGLKPKKPTKPNRRRRKKESEDRLISVREVWFRYTRDGQDVIQNLNWDIPRQKLFCLTGGNGTGKTTALRLLAGESKPYRGRIRIWDEALHCKRLPQDPTEWFDGKTVRELLEQVWKEAHSHGNDGTGKDERSRRNEETEKEERSRRNEGTEKEECFHGNEETGKKERSHEDKEIEKDVRFCRNEDTEKDERSHGNEDTEKEEALRRIAEQMEIQRFLDFPPERLSGGEQQRTALALILLSPADLLLLDEPTKGMDSYYKKKFGKLLQERVSEGKTVVMVSHDVEFCAEFGDRCAMFFDGGLVSEGNPGEFFAGNSFYTTAANRMCRKLFPHEVTVEDVVQVASSLLHLDQGEYENAENEFRRFRVD